MSVKYKIYQLNRKGETKGKWYARAVHEGTVTTDDLANIMQANCTVKRSDILAVISELVETMRDQLQNSARVKISGFGTFKIAISTTAALNYKDFNVAQNVTGMHILFQPELKIDRKGNRTQTFISSTKLAEATPYDADKAGASDGGGQDEGGQAGA